MLAGVGKRAFKKAKSTPEVWRLWATGAETAHARVLEGVAAAVLRRAGTFREIAGAGSPSPAAEATRAAAAVLGTAHAAMAIATPVISAARRHAGMTREAGARHAGEAVAVVDCRRGEAFRGDLAVCRREETIHRVAEAHLRAGT